MDPWIWQSLDGPSFCLSSKLCLCNSFHGWLFPILRRGKVSTFWSSFFLSFMCFANCILYLAILSFWANIHLSVSIYHLSSFVIELPHSKKKRKIYTLRIINFILIYLSFPCFPRLTTASVFVIHLQILFILHMYLYV